MSQELLFKKLIKAEDIYNETVLLKYEDLKDPDAVISRDGVDLHTDIYYELLAKGIIREVEEGDGTVSYETTVINPVYMSVINEYGCAIVGDEIYQFFEDGIKIIHDGKMEKIKFLEEIKNSNQKEGVSVIYLKKSSKGFGHSFNEYDEELDGRYRVTFQVYFYAGAEGVYYPDPGTCMTTTYYTEAKAQKKNIFGNWVYKNNFTPITELTGSWSYYFKLVEVGNPYNYQYIYSVTDPDSHTSPFSYNLWGGSSNYLKTTFIPDGTFCASSGWLMDECVVYNYSYCLKSDGFPDITF